MFQLVSAFSIPPFNFVFPALKSSPMARLAYFLSFLLLTVTTTAYADPSPAAEEPVYVELAGRAPAQVITKCTVPNTAALTFDDGPYWFMREVIRQLEAANGKATFFVNGNNWACIYNTELSGNIRYAFERGHQVASHTWAHKDLTTLTWDQIHDEMWRVEQAITRITGAVPAFMRPPYGNQNQLVRDASGARNQTIVLWDVDSGDSTGASVDQQKATYDAVVKRRPSTILSLQHEVQWKNVYETLPYVISKLKGAGYKFVTVADCLGRSKYQRVGPAEARNANWKC